MINMCSVIPICKFDIDKKIIDISEINSSDINIVGNGFFVSRSGLLASVAHVLPNDDVTKYALFNGKFIRIKILESRKTIEDENFIDAALGRIEINSPVINDLLNFKDVKNSEYLKIIGYSHKTFQKQDKIIRKEIRLSKTCFYYQYEIHTICLDTIHGLPLNSQIVSTKNLFSIHLGDDYSGLSGSPILNEKNNIVGILRGGLPISTGISICSGLHIRVISDMLSIYKIKS